MSEVTIKVDGLNNVRDAIKRYGKNLVDEIVAITGIVQAKVVNDAKMNHGENAHSMGRYRDRTTHLTQSIQVGPVSVDEKGVEGIVEARMEYASDVEFGTSRAHPYPFMIPAILQNISTFRASVKAAVKRARAS